MNELQNLSQIFSANPEGRRIFLRIPDYQRGYSWEEKELKDLWDDLMNLHSNEKSDSYHFTGIITVDKITEEATLRIIDESIDLTEDDNVVINDVEYEPYFIVDGQQRLVTLLILLFVLLEKVGTEEERKTVYEKYLRVSTEEGKNQYLFGYEKDTPSHQFLIGKIFQDSTMTVTEPETVYTKNLEKAKYYFEEKIDAEKDWRKQDLVKVIQEKLLFYMFIIDGTRLDMSMVFETLNYRGKQLSKLELFKNRLIYLVLKRYAIGDNNKKIRDDIRRKVVQTWLTVYEWIGKSEHGRLDDDEFLRAFWIIYFNHDEDTDPALKTFESDLFENKFKISGIAENTYLSGSEMDKLLRSLSKLVKIWYFIHYPDYIPKDAEKIRFQACDDSKRLLIALNRNRYGDFMKVLTASAMHVNEIVSEDDADIVEVNEADSHIIGSRVPDFNRIVTEIERHNFIVYLLAGMKRDTNRPHFYRKANAYFRRDFDNDDLLNEIKQQTSRSEVNHVAIKNHIYFNHQGNEHFKDWIGVKYVLYEWEEHLRGFKQPKIGYAKAYTQLIFTGDYGTKKLFPEVARSRYGDNLDKLKFSLGNLTIGEKSIAGESYENRRNSLKKGGYSDQDIAINYDVWSDSAILDRGMRMLKFIEERWDARNIWRGDENKMKQLLVDNLEVAVLKTV